jgi:hypothetical protein
MAPLAKASALELTRAEITRQLDREAHRRLGVEGGELLRRYQAGELKDCCKVADLLALAILLAEEDPLSAAA